MVRLALIAISLLTACSWDGQRLEDVEQRQEFDDDLERGFYDYHIQGDEEVFRLPGGPNEPPGPY